MLLVYVGWVNTGVNLSNCIFYSCLSTIYMLIIMFFFYCRFHVQLFWNSIIWIMLSLTIEKTSSEETLANNLQYRGLFGTMDLLRMNSWLLNTPKQCIDKKQSMKLFSHSFAKLWIYQGRYADHKAQPLPLLRACMGWQSTPKKHDFSQHRQVIPMRHPLQGR